MVVQQCLGLTLHPSHSGEPSSCVVRVVMASVALSEADRRAEACESFDSICELSMRELVEHVDTEGDVE